MIWKCRCRMPTFRITSAAPSIVGTAAIAKSAQSPEPGAHGDRTLRRRTRRPRGLLGRSLPRDAGRFQVCAPLSHPGRRRYERNVTLFNCFLMGIFEASIPNFHGDHDWISQELCHRERATVGLTSTCRRSYTRSSTIRSPRPSTCRQTAHWPSFGQSMTLLMTRASKVVRPSGRKR